MKNIASPRMLATIVFAIIGINSVTALADFTEAMADYKNKNYEAAMTEFKKLATLGHKQSQFNIGVMYLRGDGVEKNIVEAYAWTALATANDGPEYADARDLIMGKMEEQQKDKAITRTGLLLKQMSDHAIREKYEPILLPDSECKYQLKVARHGKFEPRLTDQNMLAEISVEYDFSIDKHGYPRDFSIISSTNQSMDKTVLDYIRTTRYVPTLIDGKPVDVPNVQGRIVFRINGGQWDKNGIQAYVDQLREKAKAGSAADMYKLAYLGNITPEFNLEKQESIAWYLKAAQAGMPNAQYQIGKALFRGEGCDEDETKGLRWLTLAAEEKNIDAQYYLGVSMLGSDKFKENKDQAIAWLQRAASGHHEKAMMRLAWILATDKDEKVRNPERALTLINEVYRDYPDKIRSNETLAAVQAANGDFEDAVNSQKAAIKEARSIFYPLVTLRGRLDAYKNKQPWLE